MSLDKKILSSGNY